MPPRRATRSAAAAEASNAAATSALSPLPLSVVLHIFSLLPVDCRLRCSEVCRAWRSVLLERSLWTRLHLTAASGVRMPQEFESRDALMRCAAARAGGGLRSLHLDTWFISHEALLEVMTANAGALREVHAGEDSPYLGLSADETEALLGVAPLLDVFATQLCCDIMDVEAARRALRNEAPFRPLRVWNVHADLGDEHEAEAGVIAFAADVAAHASLRALTLNSAFLDTSAALDAVVDAALTRQLYSITFWQCRLFPASAPALARLLGCGTLTTLVFVHADFIDAPAVGVLAAALRANHTLTSLRLDYVRLFDDAAAGIALVGALTGHPSLQTLSLGGNVLIAAADQAAVGAAVGTLIAANAPALTHLDVGLCHLGDDGMRALFDALPHNMHLQELECSHNGICDAFARDVLLPAVRANTSLRKLATWSRASAAAEAEAEAEAIVSRRAAA
jgi:hypothetical protein